jgi:hypothetical protein
LPTQEPRMVMQQATTPKGDTGMRNCVHCNGVIPPWPRYLAALKNRVVSKHA